MKSRIAVLGLGSALALCVGLATTASAAISPAAARPAAARHAVARPAASITSTIPRTAGGVASTCQLAVTSFQVVNGTLNAVGTVTGGGVTAPFQAPVQDPPGACPVLSLTLGPLHLDLLGLVVDLNQVNLNITAQPGPGNLLGNLLCAVSNLLNNTGSGAGLSNALQQIVNLLNQILSGL